MAFGYSRRLYPRYTATWLLVHDLTSVGSSGYGVSSTISTCAGFAKLFDRFHGDVGGEGIYDGNGGNDPDFTGGAILTGRLFLRL